jgi:hypothetical protein
MMSFSWVGRVLPVDVDTVETVLHDEGVSGAGELSTLVGVGGDRREVLRSGTTTYGEDSLQVGVRAFHSLQSVEAAFGTVYIDLEVGPLVGELLELLAIKLFGDTRRAIEGKSPNCRARQALERAWKQGTSSGRLKSLTKTVPSSFT